MSFDISISDDINKDIEDEINKDIDDDVNNDLENEIKKIDNENDIINYDDFDNKIDKPIIEISPNGAYLVAYNPEDYSIVGWNAKDIEEGQLTKSDAPVKINDYINQISVSDDKKLAYTICKNNKCYTKIFDINLSQEIELNLTGNYSVDIHHHTFNLKGEFIIYNNWKVSNQSYYKEYKIIKVYSTLTKNNKWICKKIYEVPEYFELINMSKYDKIYLFSNKSIYEWDHYTEKSIKIFYYEEFKSRYINKRELKHDVRISSNKMFICLNIRDIIIIYCIESAIPIVSLDMNNDTSLYKLVKYSELLPSLPSLLPLLSSKTQNSIVEYYWKEGLNRLGLKDENLQILPNNIQITGEYVFGILDGYAWKIKLEENISKMKFLFQNFDEEVIKNCNVHYEELLNINLFNPVMVMDKIAELFQRVSDSESEYKRKLNDDDQNLVERIIITDKLLQVWKIQIIGHNKIMLRVFKKADVISKWELADIKITKFNVSDVRKIKLLEIKLFTDDDIILITTIGFLIYHFNKDKKSISLNYWSYLELTYPVLGEFEGNSEDFNDLKKLLRPYCTLQFNLPLPNYDSFKICDEWISYVKDNKENLLKYGDKLLSFAIKDHKLDLIEEIYKKCINWFKEDLGNNWMFLSIITSTMSLLNKHYPEYALRYSLDTTMIIDHPFYSIEYQPTNLHIYSFQYLQLVDLTRSTLWLKYNLFLSKLFDSHEPIFYSVLSSKLTTKTSISPMITFMIPYIKFVNYPQDYNWFLELIKPQPSPFIETISEDVYKTCNGEAIINFKWKSYGWFYYSIIWIEYMALLGSFTAAVTIPQYYIDDDIRKRLLITSIILGFIQLSIEIRQFIYNPLKWFLDFWNYIDIIAYLLPIYTSIYWLQTNVRNNHLISFTCLFLDIKFLIFLRVFESIGIFFAIIISVGKQIIYLLLVLLIILISFAHALYILLLPETDFSFKEPTNNNDPNNPWNLAPAYHRVFENGTIDPNPYLIQLPDGNTNMFVSFKTALLAMYLFLTGDTSSVYHWQFIDNPSLAIMIVLFSLLMGIYIINLFIGIFSNAIEKVNSRVSYFVYKAEILAEIELFYLLPHQRRWNKWFPEVIHYYAKLDDIRIEVNAMMERKVWNTHAFPELKDNLLNILNIHDE